MELEHGGVEVQAAVVGHRGLLPHLQEAAKQAMVGMGATASNMGTTKTTCATQRAAARCKVDIRTTPTGQIA